MAKRRRNRRTYDAAAAQRREQRALSRSLRNVNDLDNRLSRQSQALAALLRMDPYAFEGLIADLVRSMGYNVALTKRSGDGGVDIEAHDPHPIRGGTIIFSVKRYSRTVQPAHVRDLYGTLRDHPRASRAVLVTTSHYGPSSHTFVADKPMSLITGSELLALLRRQGLDAFTDEPAPATDAGAQVTDGEGSETYTLGFTWEGEHEYDISVIACQGDKAADERQFVFYNNTSNPEGTIKFVDSVGDERACVLIHFDQLPTSVDRLLLIAAADTEADPEANMSGFTGAMIRLFSPDGDELDAVSLPPGQAGSTAWIIGQLDRCGETDWTFSFSTAEQPSDLLSIVVSCGIEVED